MTRFARYSTKGIKKPPLEATPWSELAPPAASAAVASPETGKCSAADPASEIISTPGLEKKLDKSMSDNGKQVMIASTSKKKIKKKVTKRLSQPQTPMLDLDASQSVLDESSEIGSKMNESRASLDDEQVESPANRSSKKKKKRVVKKAILPNDVEEEDSFAALDSLKLDDETISPKKELKRKDGDDRLPKKKKKRLSSDNGLTNTPNLSKDRQASDSPEQQPPKTTHKDINGNHGPPNKKKRKQKQKSRLPPPSADSGAPLLAEGPLMTQFEGYWVRRRAVPRLERVRAELAAAITDPQTLKREMKKRKRAEHRLLLSQLAARGARKPTSAAARLQDDGDAADDDLESADEGADAAGDGRDADDDEGSKNEAARREPAPPPRRTVADDRNPSAGGGAPREERMVKFDGVWMTADAVGRLKELRRQLKMQRVSDVVLKQTMKTARRREEMKRKRDAKRVCLGCRQPGHFISDCPRRAAGAKAPVTGLCFRCGSTEHRLSECRRPADGGRLPYAVCFVCSQTGHLSRDCTLNPNGVYPRGGACKVCQRRDHLADDCPERREEEAAAGAPRLTTIADGALEDDYQHDFRETATPAAAAAAPVVRKPRQVKF